MKLALSTIFSMILGIVIGINYQTVAAQLTPPDAIVADATPSPAPEIKYEIVEAKPVGKIPFGWNGIIDAHGHPMVGQVSVRDRYNVLKQELDAVQSPEDRMILMREIAALPPMVVARAIAVNTSHAVMVASYHVEPGDTLTRIATGLKTDVGAVFQANPHAFVNGDPNLLMAGVDLKIPEHQT
jgi:hypothetical protein